MKLVKFFAIAVAAFAVACAPEENKTNAPEFELTESTIYCELPLVSGRIAMFGLGLRVVTTTLRAVSGQVMLWRRA